MKKRMIFLVITGLLINSCMPLKKGVITKKWHEEAISSMSIVITGKITVPMYLYDDEDFVIKVEGFNKQGKFKTQNYYISKLAYDTIHVGDWFCATADCYTKDK